MPQIVVKKQDDLIDFGSKNEEHKINLFDMPAENNKTPDLPLKPQQSDHTNIKSDILDLDPNSKTMKKNEGLQNNGLPLGKANSFDPSPKKSLQLSDLLKPKQKQDGIQSQNQSQNPNQKGLNVLDLYKSESKEKNGEEKKSKISELDKLDKISLHQPKGNLPNTKILPDKFDVLGQNPPFSKKISAPVFISSNPTHTNALNSFVSPVKTTTQQTMFGVPIHAPLKTNTDKKSINVLELYQKQEEDGNSSTNNINKAFPNMFSNDISQFMTLPVNNNVESFFAFNQKPVNSGDFKTVSFSQSNMMQLNRPRKKSTADGPKFKK